MPATIKALSSADTFERPSLDSFIEFDDRDDLSTRSRGRLNHASITAIEKIVAAAPPLTVARREKLAALLGGVAA